MCQNHSKKPYRWYWEQEDGEILSLPLKTIRQEPSCQVLLKTVPEKTVSENSEKDCLVVRRVPDKLEDFKLDTEIKIKVFGQLEVGVHPCKGDHVELFASVENADAKLFCSRANSAFWYNWGSLGLCYANPPFSLLPIVLHKILKDRARVILVTPEEGKFEGPDHEYWKTLLKEITLNSVLLPNQPTYWGKALDRVLPPPDWRTRVSLVDGNCCTVSPSFLSCIPEKSPEMLSYKGLNLIDLKAHFPNVLAGDPSPKTDSDNESVTESTLGPVSTICREEDNTAFLVELCLEELDQEKTEKDFSSVSKKTAKPSKASFPVAKEDLVKIKEQLLNRIEFLEDQSRYRKIAKWKTSVRFPGEDEVDDFNQCVNLAPGFPEESFEEHSAFMASCQPKKDEFGHSNLKPEENMAEKIAEVKNEVIKKILLKHQAVFGELPGASTVKKLVTMDRELKDEFKAKSVRLHPYQRSQEASD